MTKRTHLALQSRLAHIIHPHSANEFRSSKQCHLKINCHMFQGVFVQKRLSTACCLQNLFSFQDQEHRFWLKCFLALPETLRHGFLPQQGQHKCPFSSLSHIHKASIKCQLSVNAMMKALHSIVSYQQQAWHKYHNFSSRYQYQRIFHSFPNSIDTTIKLKQQNLCTSNFTTLFLKNCFTSNCKVFKLHCPSTTSQMAQNLKEAAAC